MPERGTVSAGLTTSRLPPTVPDDCGLNVTLNVALCPAAKVRGRLGPLIENPLPVVVTANRVTFQERSFVSTTGTVALLPTATWPNEALDGVAVTDSLLTPAPSASSVKVELDASLENLIVPCVHPFAEGVKLTLTPTLCPAANERGRLSWGAVNSLLLIVTSEIVTLVCPVFVTVAIKVSL